MSYSLAAWLEEWATGDGKESYLDVLIDTGQVKYNRNQQRTRAGKALRDHLFGSERAPSADLVRKAIRGAGTSAALAAMLEPVIASGTASPRGAFRSRLEQAAARTSEAAATHLLGRFQLEFAPNISTFVTVANFTTIFDSPDRTKKGVYLWCIEFQDALLTNYVGKTWAAGGFVSRIGQQLSEYQAGKYCTPVDVEKFIRGKRVELGCRMTPELLKRELDVILPLYRILLLPLASDAESKMVESTIVHRQCQHPTAAQFLCNKNTHTYVSHGELEFGVKSPRIIGLTM